MLHKFCLFVELSLICGFLIPDSGFGISVSGFRFPGFRVVLIFIPCFVRKKEKKAHLHRGTQETISSSITMTIPPTTTVKMVPVVICKTRNSVFFLPSRRT